MNRNKVGIHTGISSLLMVLVVLCLTTFGLLSYSTARADSVLTEKAAKHMEAYYIAQAKAEEVIASIDTQLSRFGGGSQQELDDFVAGLPQTVTGVTADGATLTFRVPVDDTQEISGIITVAPMKSFSKKRYTSFCRLVSTQEFQSDTNLNVWQG
jgi:hypothetical protein